MRSNSLYHFVAMAFCLVLLGTASATAQRIVQVPEGIGTLDSTIKADAPNRLANPNTEYVLARNGYYGTLTSVNNTDPVYIRAEYGPGPKPYVRPSLPTVGSAVRSFAPKANLTLHGLYIVGLDDHPTTPAMLTAMVRPTAANLRIVIDSCQFDYDGQASVRLDNAGNKVFITNTIFSNLGDENSANGRVVDTRGTDQDSIVIQNCIIYNVTEKLVRTGTEGATGRSNYFVVDHNTIVNCPNNTQFNFGRVKEGRFTNNLMYNTACIGDTSTWSGFLMADPRTDGVAQSIVISNNNWHIDTSITNAYQTIKPPYYLFQPRRRHWMDSCVTRLSTGFWANNDTTAFTIATAMPSLKEVVIAQHDTALKAASNQKVNLPAAGGSYAWNEAHYVLNTTYSSSYWFYTGGRQGERIGSMLDWNLPLVSVADRPGLPEEFALHQNFPNPFNPSTSVQFDLPRAAMVTLTVHNVLGQRVATLADGPYAAGSHTTTWNAASMASGTYFLQMRVDGSVVSGKKMLLMK